MAPIVLGALSPNNRLQRPIDPQDPPTQGDLARAEALHAHAIKSYGLGKLVEEDMASIVIYNREVADAVAGPPVWLGESVRDTMHDILGVPRNNGNINIAEQIAHALAPLANLNANMANLNANMANLNADMANLKTDMANLKADMANLNGNMTNLNGDMTNLKADMANLNGDMANLNGNMTNLNGDMTNIRQEFQEVVGPIRNFQRDVQEAIAPVKQLLEMTNRISAMNYNFIFATQEGDVFEIVRFLSGKNPTLPPYRLPALLNMAAVKALSDTQVKAYYDGYRGNVRRAGRDTEDRRAAILTMIGVTLKL